MEQIISKIVFASKYAVPNVSAEDVETIAKIAIDAFNSERLSEQTKRDDIFWSECVAVRVGADQAVLIREAAKAPDAEVVVEVSQRPKPEVLDIIWAVANDKEYEELPTTPVALSPVVKKKHPFGSAEWLEALGTHTKTDACYIKKLRIGGITNWRTTLKEQKSPCMSRYIAKLIENYTDITLELIEADRAEAIATELQIRTAISRGDLTAINRDEALNDRWEYIEAIPLLPEKDLNEFNLFGGILPPRRANDVSSIYIFDAEEPEGFSGNSYVKTSQLFTFRVYKTASAFGVQKFVLSAESGDFIFLDDEAISKAQRFLDSRPEGRLYSGCVNSNTHSTLSKRKCGFNQNDARHYWATRMHQRANRVEQIRCAYWMAHKVGTAVTNYAN